MTQPDLAILDIKMPGSDGLEAARGGGLELRGAETGDRLREGGGGEGEGDAEGED